MFEGEMFSCEERDGCDTRNTGLQIFNCTSRYQWN